MLTASAGNVAGVPDLLVLWDVDFTLVDTRGVGTALYRLAFAELFGRDLPETITKVNMGGRTDRAIALDVLALAGDRRSCRLRCADSRLR